MPDSELLIRKANGATVKFIDDHAIGTMVVSGVTKETAMETVMLARRMFAEFDVREISTASWVLLSEEIRRGNLGRAGVMVREMAGEIPVLDTEITIEEEPDHESMRGLAALFGKKLSDGYYGSVQGQNAYVAGLLGLYDPKFGNAVGSYLSTVDDILLYAAKAASEHYVAVALQVIEENDLPIGADGVRRLRRQFAGMSSLSKTDLAKRINLTNSLMVAFADSSRVENGMLASLGHLNGLLIDMPMGEVPPVSPTYEKTRARCRKETVGTVGPGSTTYTGGPTPESLGGTPITPRPDDGDDPRDTPPPIMYGEQIEYAYYFGWSTMEWPDLIATNDRHDLYINAVSDSDGDRPVIWETHGVRQGVLYTPAPLARLNWVERTWTPEIAEYWPPYPQKAFLIPTTYRTFLTHFTIFANRKDLSDRIDGTIVEKAIDEVKDQIEDEDLEKKIREEAEEFLDELLDGVGFLGFDLGKAGSTIAKIGAGLAIDVISWIIDEVTGSQDRWEILVTHATVWVGDSPQSFVGWTLKDVASGKKKHLDPTIPSQSTSVAATQGANDQLKQLMKAAYGDIVDDLPPVITWQGECSIPAAPDEMLRNVAQGSPADQVLWPDDPYKEGCHLFLRLKGEDANYAVAIRTEVRANYWSSD